MTRQYQALIFDVFGTLVDWRNSAAGELREFFSAKGIATDPHEFADACRGEYQPSMAPIRSGEREYVPLDILHLENLETILDRFGLAEKISEEERKGLSRCWERLHPWPDSVPGLSRLRKSYLLAPCSNGSIALLSRLAKFGGLPFDAILGADIARNYKPQPEVYLGSVAALGLEPAEVVMVAAHNDDLVAARKYGLATAFVPRKTEYGPRQDADLEPTSDWEFVAEDMNRLADLLA